MPSILPATQVEDARECLSFRLGDEEYGIDILRVQEIRGYEAQPRMLILMDIERLMSGSDIGLMGGPAH